MTPLSVNYSQSQFTPYILLSAHCLAHTVTPNQKCSFSASPCSSIPQERGRSERQAHSVTKQREHVQNSTAPCREVSANPLLAAASLHGLSPGMAQPLSSLGWAAKHARLNHILGQPESRGPGKPSVWVVQPQGCKQSSPPAHSQPSPAQGCSEQVALSWSLPAALLGLSSNTFNYSLEIRWPKINKTLNRKKPPVLLRHKSCKYGSIEHESRFLDSLLFCKIFTVKDCIYLKFAKVAA